MQALSQLTAEFDSWKSNPSNVKDSQRMSLVKAPVLYILEKTFKSSSDLGPLNLFVSTSSFFPGPVTGDGALHLALLIKVGYLRTALRSSIGTDRAAALHAYENLVLPNQEAYLQRGPYSHKCRLQSR